MCTSDENVQTQEGEEDEEELEDIYDNEIVDNIDDISQYNTTEITDTPLDPKEQLIKIKEDMLNSQIKQIESFITNERSNIIRLKDKISESGKTGFFIVQAQVAEFNKKKEQESKQRIKSNKKEFVLQMLPVIDSFRNAPKISPATTEREHNMHKNFGSLLSNILSVFQKYGYKEFSAGKPYYYYYYIAHIFSSLPPYTPYRLLVFVYMCVQRSAISTIRSGRRRCQWWRARGRRTE